MKIRALVFAFAFAAASLLRRDAGVAVAQCVTCSPSQCGGGGGDDSRGAAGFTGNHGNAARCATFAVERSHGAQGKQGPKVGGFCLNCRRLSLWRHRVRCALTFGAELKSYRIARKNLRCCF